MVLPGVGAAVSVAAAAVRLCLEVAVVLAAAAVAVGSVAVRAGNWGRAAGPVVVRGGLVLLPEEGEEPAPEKAAACRSQQECTCSPGPSGASRPVLSATNRAVRPAGSTPRKRRRRSACAQ